MRCVLHCGKEYKKWLNVIPVNVTAGLLGAIMAVKCGTANAKKTKNALTAATLKNVRTIKQRRTTMITVDFHFFSFVIGGVAGALITIFGLAFEKGGE